MANVTVRLNPPAAFIAGQAAGFRAQLANLVTLWQKFEPIMAEVEEEQFASEGHGAWPGGPAYHGLVRSGALKGSLVDGLISEGPTEMVWGTDVPYAHWHQDGGTIPGRPPVRKVIDIRGEDRQRFEQATVEWLDEAAARWFSF